MKRQSSPAMANRLYLGSSATKEFRKAGFLAVKFLIACSVVLILWNGCSPIQSNSPTRFKISLNGIWDFYPNGGSERYDIRVPSFWDAPQDYGYPAEWLHMVHGVYEKTFIVPDEMAGKRIFLRLKRVSVIAKVFLNGQQIGGETSGGYLMMQLPYLIDITDVVRTDDRNTLQVQMWGGQGEVYGEEVPAEWAERDFPDEVLDEGKMLYPWGVDHYDGRRGINGDVALVAYPELYISDVFVISDLNKNTDPKDDRISIQITVVNETDEDKSIELSNRVTGIGGGGRKTFEDIEAIIDARAVKTITISDIPWTNARYWWPHEPHLYNLKTVLREDGKATDVLHTRFGYRQFYVTGNRFELNGVPVNLRAESYEFSWHEGYTHGPSTAPVLSTKELTIDVQKRLLEAYKGLNLNSLRVHKASGIDVTYDHSDEIGLLVIDEAPFWQTQQRTDGRAKDNFQDWVRRWIMERRNHPSIVMWSICNECWDSPIAGFAYETAREVDPTRPAYHQGIRLGDFEGDERNVHYTGGYPSKKFNAEELYDIYQNAGDKPKGEGESMFAEGWPLKNPDGTLSDRRSDRGDYSDPDLVAQAEWVQGVCRFVRAMRFAGLADSRSYMNWVYCFEVIEDDIHLDWSDLSAPEMKPVVLHRPICNTFTDRYPSMIRGDGYDYWRNSHSPVAVFDLEWDKKNRIGVEPVIYSPGEQLDRKLVIYNDELNGGEEIKVEWEAGILEPVRDRYASVNNDVFDVSVPYGDRRVKSVSIEIPGDVDIPGWLVLTYRAIKNRKIVFEEQNRIGAFKSVPEPKIDVIPETIDLGTLLLNQTTQLKKLKLVNRGGGASERWTVSGADDIVELIRREGNLRSMEELYFRVNTRDLESGKRYSKKLTFTGESGSSDDVTIVFRVGA